MYLQQLIENVKVKAVRNDKAPKGVYIILNRDSKTGKVVSTDTVYPGNPIKQNSIWDIKHPLINHQSDKWSSYDLPTERSSAENVKAAVAFISNWLMQGKDSTEKANKVTLFKEFAAKELGPSVPMIEDVFGYLKSCGEKQELLLVKFITETIQVKA